MSPVTSSTSSTSTGTDAYAATAPAAQSTDVNKNMFLQLFVAQLKNQDPLNPSDGTQFITQLAQFQQLEQSINSGQDITAIRQDVDKMTATNNTSNSTGNNSNGIDSNGTDSNSSSTPATNS